MWDSYPLLEGGRKSPRGSCQGSGGTRKFESLREKRAKKPVTSEAFAEKA